MAAPIVRGCAPEALWGRHGHRLFARAGCRPAVEVLERRDLLAAFTPGDLVIYRVGTGTGSLSSSGTAVFLDEYTPSGSLVQSIAMPTTASGYNNPLVGSGTATSEGQLTDSANGQYLVLTGYDASVGTASVASTASANTPRTVGLIDASGFINTSTALNNVADGNNVRSAVSTNGLQIWVGGAGGSSSPGVGFATLGGTSATQLSTAVTNVRQVNIFNGQLYLSTQAGSSVRVATVGTGEPTTAGQTVTNLPGLGTSTVPNGFFFAPPQRHWLRRGYALRRGRHHRRRSHREVLPGQRLLGGHWLHQCAPRSRSNRRRQRHDGVPVRDDQRLGGDHRHSVRLH